MSEALAWNTEQRYVRELIPMPNNPRKLTSKQKDDLAASIAKFNLMSIPAINTDNGIVSGHQRIKILLLLGSRVRKAVQAVAPSHVMATGLTKLQQNKAVN